MAPNRKRQSTTSSQELSQPWTHKPNVTYPNCLPPQIPEKPQGILWIYRELAGNQRHQRVMEAIGEEIRKNQTQSVQSYQHSLVIPPPHTIIEETPWNESLDNWVTSSWDWKTVSFTSQITTKYVILANFDQWKPEMYDLLNRTLHNKWEKITGIIPRIGDLNWKNVVLIGIVEPSWEVPECLCHWVGPLPSQSRLPTYQEVIRTTKDYLGKDLMYGWRLPDNAELWSWRKWWQELQHVSELRQRSKRNQLESFKFEYITIK